MQDQEKIGMATKASNVTGAPVVAHAQMHAQTGAETRQERGGLVNTDNSNFPMSLNALYLKDSMPVLPPCLPKAPQGPQAGHHL